jgi:hypothetical protein
MNKINFSLVAVMFMMIMTAQDHDFGKVSKNELAEQYNPNDSTADATILYKKERIYFTFAENVGFTQIREVQMRIKIYNKEGFEWANKKVYLYNGNEGYKESLKNLKGYTFNLDNGKIKREKMSSSATFKEEVSETTVAESFTLPNINEGSVVEYRYEIVSESPFIDDLYLQYQIPVKALEIIVETPQYYSYKKVFNPRAYFTPNFIESQKAKTLTTTSKVKSARVSSDSPFSTTIGSGYQRQKSTTDYVDNILKINEANIEALKAESFSGSINNYRAKLSMELNALLNTMGIETRSFASNWEKVSKTIYESSSFGDQLNRRGFFKKDLEPLLAGIEDDFQKAGAIENLVKAKVKWNGIYGKYAQKGIREAYKEGSGNVADINLLVVAMMRSANLDAFPVLVSTSNNGIPLFPTIDGFNYVIAMVKKGDSYMLFDATDPYSFNNVLPRRVLNWKGRAIYDKDVSEWVDLIPKERSLEAVMMNVKIDEDLSISGNVKKQLTDYLAMNYRKSAADISENDHIKKITSGKGDLQVSDLQFENAENLLEPVKLSYSYELKDGLDQVGDQIYFNPLLFLGTQENPFKLDERRYPIDFIYPAQERYTINILLPDGYSVESLPKTEAFAFRDSDYKFVYRIRENGKYIQLSMNFEINSSIVRPTDYKQFKQFFSKIVEKQQEQVVLSKTES